jgi:hypothetical protein
MKALSRAVLMTDLKSEILLDAMDPAVDLIRRPEVGDSNADTCRSGR